MQHYRYGKINPSDHWISWIGIVVLLLFSIASYMFDSSFLFVAFPIMYAIVWLCVILVPYCERFVVRDDSITVLRQKKTHTVILPLELTLVVSYVDICPPLAKRTAFGNQTHILKDKYAISILQKMPLEVVLEALHRNYVQKYTTSTIQTAFDDYRFIYSFVCDQLLIDKLIANKKCLLIIPETLVEKISFDSSAVSVYIDTRC